MIAISRKVASGILDTVLSILDNDLVQIMGLFILVSSIAVILFLVTARAECIKQATLNNWQWKFTGGTCYLQLDGYWIPRDHVYYTLDHGGKDLGQ